MMNNIPDFQSLMLPFLKLVQDGRTHTLNDIYEKLCIEYNLSQEDKEALLPSGNQAIMMNRVGWTRTYLKKAGLISSPQRANFVITQQGRQILESSPTRIDVAYLKKLPVFQEWIASYNSTTPKSKLTDVDNFEIPQVTPSELIETGYVQMNDSLSFDLLEKMKQLTDKQFEHLVLKVHKPVKLTT